MGDLYNFPFNQNTIPTDDGRKQIEVGWVPNSVRARTSLKDFVFWETYRRNVWVRACVDIIARRATRDIYRLVDELEPDNPDVETLKVFFEDCNPNSSFRELLKDFITDLLIYGRTYMFNQYTLGGDVANIWPMDTRITFPETDGHGDIIAHWQVYNGNYIEFTPEEVIYVRLGNEVEGLSPIETLINSIASEFNAEAFNAALFENNLNIGVVISLPGASEEQAQETQQHLEAKYTSAKNAHKPVVLRQDAKLVKDGAANVKDIAWEKLIELSRSKACAMYGVPAFKLGVDGHTNRSSGDNHDKTFWMDTVQPLVETIYAQITRQFIRDVWGFPTIQMLPPLMATLPTNDEIDMLMKFAQMGLGTYNDLRRIAGMEAVVNGDRYVIWTAGGYQRLDMTALPGVGDSSITPDEADEQLAAMLNPPQPGQEGDSGAAVTPDTGDSGASTDNTGDGSTPQPDNTEADSRIVALSDKFAALAEFVYRGPTVLHPGSKGGSGYYDAKGTWHYGTPPLTTKEQRHENAVQKQHEAYLKKQAAAAKKAARTKETANRKAQRDKEKAQREKARLARQGKQDADKSKREKERVADKNKREAERQQKEKERVAARQSREAEAKAKAETRAADKAKQEAERQQKEAERKQVAAEKKAAADEKARIAAEQKLQIAVQKLAEQAAKEEAKKQAEQKKEADKAKAAADKQAGASKLQKPTTAPTSGGKGGGKGSSGGKGDGAGKGPSEQQQKDKAVRDAKSEVLHMQRQVDSAKTPEDVDNALAEFGWGNKGSYGDATSARDAARQLATTNPDKVYSLVKAGDKFIVAEKPLKEFNSKDGAVVAPYNSRQKNSTGDNTSSNKHPKPPTQKTAAYEPWDVEVLLAEPPTLTLSLADSMQGADMQPFLVPLKEAFDKWASGMWATKTGAGE
jgi:HK97 family phage portal protein/TolA protein